MQLGFREGPGHRDEYQGGTPLWVGLPWPRRGTAPLVLTLSALIHPWYHNHHQVKDSHVILKCVEKVPPLELEVRSPTAPLGAACCFLT